jgi:hypothetical protein
MIGSFRFEGGAQKTLEPSNLFAMGAALKSGKFFARRLEPGGFGKTRLIAADTAASSNAHAPIDVTNFCVEIRAQRMLREHLFKHRPRHAEILVNAGVVKLDLKRLRSRIIAHRPQARRIDPLPTHRV